MFVTVTFATTANYINPGAGNDGLTHLIRWHARGHLEHFQLIDDNGDPVVIEVRQGGGLGRRELVSAELAAYLSVCDGSLSARAAIPAIAQLAEVSEERVRGEVLPAIRRWVADGILRPAS